MSQGKKLVYALDDEADILTLIRSQLSASGYEVGTFSEPRSFWQQLKTRHPDIILLDIMLPEQSGLEICKQLKKESKYETIPIVMVTARGEEVDKILGLELGADDYMVKPFSTRELIARIKVILKRSEGFKSKKSEILDVGPDLQIDLQRYKVYVKSSEIKLTATEFRILSILSENREWVLSREQILEKLWGNDKFVIDRTIDVHIRHLRQKLGDAGSLIKNIRGVGYKIEV